MHIIFQWLLGILIVGSVLTLFVMTYVPPGG